MNEDASQERPRVALFVTCLVDVMRPNVGFAAARLIEQAGFEVVVPSQACCGQPPLNSGDKNGARRLALETINTLDGYQYVVVPSGSCAATVVHHYAELFEEGSLNRQRAEDLGARTYELTQFLTRFGSDMTFDREAGSQSVTYHDSCSGLRELKIKEQPRQLLSCMDGVTLVEMKDSEACCGFGGAFCVKYPEISGQIVSEKCRDVEATGAEVLLLGDVGCLLNIEGRLSRLDKPIKVRHIAEFLSGFAEDE